MATENTLINEHILEVRYAPNPKVLDYRGTWAETISRQMNLSEWQIQENRIDVYDKDQTKRAFVSYRNAGILIKNSPTKNYFPDQGNKLFRYLLDQASFGKKIFVSRIGVRSRFAVPYNGSFSDLLGKYTNNFLSITKEAKDIFKGELIDAGGPVNFKTNAGFINTQSGPMEKDQLGKFLTVPDNPPDVSLYLDLDYWNKPDKEIDERELLHIIKQYADDLWDIYEKTCTLILS